jgi:hypothetical protein
VIRQINCIVFGSTPGMITTTINRALADQRVLNFRTTYLADEAQVPTPQSV